MKKHLPIVAGIVLGLLFVMSAVTVLFNLVKMPPMPEGTWSMSGKSNFAFKVFGLFMNCDNMAGRDFEKGLAALKTITEAATK